MTSHSGVLYEPLQALKWSRGAIVMPNGSNVISPINIHGTGRSGTTLLQNILSSLGFVQNCNETNDFVFGCFRAGEMLNPSHDKQTSGGKDSWASRALHAALCTAMFSDKPSWCQKLAGLPKSIVWDRLITHEDLAFASEPYPFPFSWYWRVLSQAFPHSADVLILRDYRDVIVSRSLYSNWDPLEIAKDIAVYFNIVAHPASRIAHTIRFEELVLTPIDIVSNLFDYLGIAFCETVLEPMNWYASPSPTRGLTDARAVSFSWLVHHPAVITEEMDRVIDPARRRLGARFTMYDEGL